MKLRLRLFALISPALKSQNGRDMFVINVAACSAIVTIIYIFHFGQIFESAFFLETPCSCRHQWWLLAFHSDGQQVKCNWAITNRCSALQLGNQPDFPFYNPSSDVQRLLESIFCKMFVVQGNAAEKATDGSFQCIPYNKVKVAGGQRGPF